MSEIGSSHVGPREAEPGNGAAPGRIAGLERVERRLPGSPDVPAHLMAEDDGGEALEVGCELEVAT